VDARSVELGAMTLPALLVLSAATALAVFLATPAVLRRLPEPTGDTGAATGDGADVKVPYAALATRRFAAILGVLAAAAVATAALTQPPTVLPGWLVLATLGLLLAAIDARTTWLPLPLTRVAWVAMGVATAAGAILGGWAQLLRGLGGFLAAGAAFGVIWLVTRGGIGFGDVRFAPLVGAATAAGSWSLLAAALVLGSLAGALVGLVRLAAGRRGAFAYAPSILAGAYLAAVVTWLTT
jgi:leader peptidase (prepilin peptidase)/N-methyltransferase